MKTKTSVLVTIDTNIFKIARSKLGPRELSPTVEKLLSNFIDDDDVTNNINDAEKVEKQLKEEKLQMAAKMAEINNKLTQVKLKKEKEEKELENQKKEEIREAENLMKGFKEAGLLRGV